MKTMDKTFLRDIPKKKYEQFKDKMPTRFARRCEHFFLEYKRVREAVTAWATDDLERFGRISFESCESSIHNYECGSPELIAIYKAMRETDGIYGGRFSGAGFKGACIAIIYTTKAESIEKSVIEKYLAEFPQYKKTFKTFICESDDGARFI